MNISKIHNGLLGVLAFYMIGFASVYGYVNYIDVPDLTYENLPFPVANKTVVAGQIVPITISRCNHSDTAIVYTITRGIQNLDTQAAQGLAPNSRILEPGCSESTSYANRTPDGLPEGNYRLFGATILPGRYTKDHSIVWYSAPFKVIPPK